MLNILHSQYQTTGGAQPHLGIVRLPLRKASWESSGLHYLNKQQLLTGLLTGCLGARIMTDL